MIPLTLTLERFEENLAIFRHESLGEFKWPTQYLPPGLKEGEKITLKVTSPNETEEEKYAVMRRLLEELIN